MAPAPPEPASPRPPESAAPRGLFRQWTRIAREALAAWSSRYEEPYLLLMASVVGIAMGVVSVVFRLLVNISHRFFQRSGANETANMFGWPSLEDGVAHLVLRLFLPALGGLIVGLLIYRILRLKGGHGVPSVMKAVATGQVNLHPSMAIKSATSPITLATGGSSGREGPIIEIGAVVGSSIGSMARVRKDMMGTLVGCGAAAGIGAIFNAPIGGVVFALELIMRDFHVRKFGPIVIASVLASVTSSALMPNDPVFHRIDDTALASIHASGYLVFQFLVLGIVCAAIGSLLIKALYWSHDFFQELKMPLWIKPGVGGIFVGLVGLFAPGVLGESYETINRLILTQGSIPENIVIIIVILLVLAFLKVVATSLTVGSGGTGGIFAPAMVSGAFLGAGIGLLSNHFMTMTAPDYRIFALVGMAGSVACVLGTPLAAILIIYEVSGGRYELVLPLMIAVAVSTLASSRMRKGSVYTLSLLRDGFDLEDHSRRVRDPLQAIPIRDIMTRSFRTLRPSDTLPTLLQLLADTEDEAFIVCDERLQLHGVVSTGDLRSVVAMGDVAGAAIIAADVVDSFAPVLLPETPASKALEIFSTTDVEAIAVVEDARGRRCLGVVLRSAVLKAFSQAARGN